MLSLTNYTVDQNLLQTAVSQLPNEEFKHSINKPIGNFFYDPWEIKEEFKNTVWEKILNTLPGPIGEARVIQLQHGTCYMSHCDIDDRYHLNLEGQYSFLIDLDSEKMFKTVADGKWYVINTGIRHVAANFGSVRRVQLVVRQLLNNAELKDSVVIKIKPICVNPRFEFDDIVSPHLNLLNKQGRINSFEIIPEGVQFNLDKRFLHILDLFSADKFQITIGN